jgi:IclR family transcriptional regulator, pca regulon regulatory protein
VSTDAVSTDASPRAAEYVQSLERGLAVIQAFSSERPSMTLAEVAREAGLTRATARRLLFTLQHLGYARFDGKRFALTPKVLDIGYAYLSSLDLASIAQAEMESLVERTHESCSAAVLDGTDIVYVVRVPTTRIMTISLGLGSRLPAYATSMGRVLLADLLDGQLASDLASHLDGHRDGHGEDGHVERLPALTSRTITDPGELRAELDRVRRQGWALVDQELEDGVRSVAAPLRDARGRVIAAINISGHAGRVTLSTMRDRFLPELLATAERINERLARR